MLWFETLFFLGILFSFGWMALALLGRLGPGGVPPGAAWRTVLGVAGMALLAAWLGWTRADPRYWGAFAMAALVLGGVVSMGLASRRDRGATERPGASLELGWLFWGFIGGAAVAMLVALARYEPPALVWM